MYASASRIKLEKHYSSVLSFLVGYTISKVLAGEITDAGYFASSTFIRRRHRWRRKR
jgi:uncharacterized metal-binding protein